MFWKIYSDRFLDRTALRFIPRRVTPNQVTVLRILSLPIIFYLLLVESYARGLVIFVLAALTDALDGALARTRNQITERGKVLDAVADRGLIGLVAVAFIPRFFGWPLLAAIVALEVFNALAAWRAKRKLGYNPGANWAGAIKMIVQSFAFGMIFLGVAGAGEAWINYAGPLLYASLLFTFAEAFLYKENRAGEQ